MRDPMGQIEYAGARLCEEHRKRGRDDVVRIEPDRIRAKGLDEPTVLVRHVVRNALLPVITVIGYGIGFLLSGTIVVETVFAWPGIGRPLFQSIGQRDYVVVQAVVTLGAVVVVVANLLTDIVYAYVDPRIRFR